MHDIRAIRENPAEFDARLARRGLSGMSSSILALDEARRARILAAETAQAAQNAASKEVGAAKARGDNAEFERLRALVADKKAEIARLTDEASVKGGAADPWTAADDATLAALAARSAGDLADALTNTPEAVAGASVASAAPSRSRAGQAGSSVAARQEPDAAATRVGLAATR